MSNTSSIWLMRNTLTGEIALVDFSEGFMEFIWSWSDWEQYDRFIEYLEDFREENRLRATRGIPDEILKAWNGEEKTDD